MHHKWIRRGFSSVLLAASSAFAQAGAKPASAHVEYQYMALCTDGDGALTAWLSTFDAANKAGKDHEVATKGHRWTVLSREKPVAGQQAIAQLSGSSSFLKAGTLVHIDNTTAECEGSACGVTQKRWDGQGYWFKNTSPNRAIVVELKNWAAGNTIPLNPGEEKLAFLKGFFLPYSSNYK